MVYRLWTKSYELSTMNYKIPTFTPQNVLSLPTPCLGEESPGNKEHPAS